MSKKKTDVVVLETIPEDFPKEILEAERKIELSKTPKKTCSHCLKEFQFDEDTDMEFIHHELLHCKGWDSLSVDEKKEKMKHAVDYGMEKLKTNFYLKYL